MTRWPFTVAFRMSLLLCAASVFAHGQWLVGFVGWDRNSWILIIIFFIPPMIWAWRYPLSRWMKASVYVIFTVSVIVLLVSAPLAIYSNAHPTWTGIAGFSSRYRFVLDSGDLKFVTDGGWESPWWISLTHFASGLATLAFLSVMLLLPDSVRSSPGRRRRASGQCLQCGYPLTGNVSGVCPECGTAIAKNANVPT